MLNQSLESKQDKLTNPLTRSDVVDSLTSTSTNTPLSAAQGKALRDTILKIFATSGIKTLNSTYGCGYYKNGNTVIVTADFVAKTIPQAGVTIGTLPASYRPSMAMYCRNGFDNQNGQMSISPGGVVLLSSSNGSFTYGHFSLCYPASSNFD